MLTGFSPAVCRAAVMISLIIIGKTYSRYINTLNILAISAFLLLLYDPLFITDVGFQLSYLAVGGLLIFQPMVYKWFTFKNKWADKLWSLCSLSIAAQVITFPLSAFYFHQFPVYFLVSNLFIIIPVEIIMYAGLLYLIIPPLPFISASLGFVLEKSIIIMNKGLVIVENSPFAGISKIWLTTTEYLLCYGIIIGLFYFLFNQKKWLLKTSLVMILLLAASISLKRITSLQSDTITFLNLRKHQGLVFRSGNKAIVLADLKTDDKNYRYSVQPYLDSCKITDAAWHDIKENMNSALFLKRDNLIQFENKRILLLNKGMNNVQLSRKLKVDYLYVTGNPHINLIDINKNYTFTKLIIDGSNTDRVINDLTKQAQTAHINYQVLKRNKSIIVTSD
jgi:competence protein ComEC